MLELDIQHEKKNQTLWLILQNSSADVAIIIFLCYVVNFAGNIMLMLR